MKSTKSIFSVFIIFLILVNYSTSICAQNNPIYTVVPFLLLDGDARIAGFGSIGTVANEFYADAGTWSNPALLSRRKKSVGGNIILQPKWRYDLIGDDKMYNVDANCLYSINKKNSFAFHLKYFNYGKFTIYDIHGSVTGIIEPYEYSTKISYAHHFENGFSIGTSASYIHSDLTGDQNSQEQNIHPGKSLALGVGWNYDNSFVFKEKVNCNWSIGGSLNNLGSKISYTENGSSDFIPANLSVGGMLTPSFELSKNVLLQIDLAYEASKLLVPTRAKWAQDSLTGESYIVAGMDPDVSVLQSYFQSFHDAPDGAKEEFHEISHKFAIEARLRLFRDFTIALRQGMYRQHKTKRELEYKTTGLGLGYKGISLNWSSFSYKDADDLTNTFIQLGYVYTFVKLPK